MLTKLHIENFKSIHNLDIELGRINVFIGENGCGKSNILEALALASCAKDNRLKNDDFAQKGIRVTRPDMMMNSFLGGKAKEEITIDCFFENKTADVYEEPICVKTSLSTNSPNDIFSTWTDNEKITPTLPTFEELQKMQKDEKLYLMQKEAWEKFMAAVIPDNRRRHPFIQYLIYEIQTNPLRGFNNQTLEIPGRNGENLDLLLDSFSEKEWQQLAEHSNFILWLDDDGIKIDKDGSLGKKGLKLRSDSKLYFKDKFMQKKNNIFSVENANEGALHILFYLALFISKKTSPLFAIDNIENALNPHLCRVLMENIVKLSKKNNKQALITTHSPAVLDGINLHDEEQRLFVVSRNDKGHTQFEWKRLKPNVVIDGNRLKLSELWMRGHLGGIAQNF